MLREATELEETRNVVEDQNELLFREIQNAENLDEKKKELQKLSEKLRYNENEKKKLVALLSKKENCFFIDHLFQTTLNSKVEDLTKEKIIILLKYLARQVDLQPYFTRNCDLVLDFIHSLISKEDTKQEESIEQSTSLVWNMLLFGSCAPIFLEKDILTLIFSLFQTFPVEHAITLNCYGILWSLTTCIDEWEQNASSWKQEYTNQIFHDLFQSSYDFDHQLISCIFGILDRVLNYLTPHDKHQLTQFLNTSSM